MKKKFDIFGGTNSLNLYGSGKKGKSKRIFSGGKLKSVLSVGSSSKGGRIKASSFMNTTPKQKAFMKSIYK